MSEGKIEKANKGATAIKGILGGLLSIAIGVGVIILLINMFSNKGGGEQHISITEAQKKCTVMEAVDMRKYEDAGDDVFDLASKRCLTEWDMSKNPNNTEEKFIDIVEKDWESRKSENIEGQTIEELYNEIKDSL